MRRVIARVGVLAVGVILVMAPAAGAAGAHTAPVAFCPKKGAIIPLGWQGRARPPTHLQRTYESVLIGHTRTYYFERE